MTPWDSILGKEIPADQGELRRRNLARVLGQLWYEKFSGIIKVVQEPFARYIILREGLIDAIRSSDPDDRLGECLVYHGLISAPSFYIASQKAIQTGSQLGHILIQENFLPPEDLMDALKIQTSTILSRIINWSAGEFYVYLIQHEIPDSTPLGLSTPNLLFEVSRTVERWTIIFSEIQRMDKIPMFIANNAWPLIAPHLSPEENHLVGLCNGRFNLSTVCEMSYLSSFHTLRIIWILSALQLLKLTDTKAISGSYPEFQPAETDIKDPPLEYQEFVFQDLVQKYNEMFQAIIEPLQDTAEERLPAFLEHCLEPIRRSLPHRMKNVAFNNYGEIEYELFLQNFSGLGYERKLREISIVLEDILYALIYNLEEIISPNMAKELRDKVLASHRNLK